MALESQGSSDARKHAKYISPYLPPELVLKVGELLPWKDLYSLVQTCRKIKDTLEDFLYQQHGEQLLIWAASNGWVFLVKNVLQRKKSIDVNLIESGRTALARAFENAHPDIATLLLQQKGIDISDKTNGMTLLETAIVKGCYPLVDQILQCHMVATAAAANTIRSCLTPIIAALHLPEGSPGLPLCWETAATHYTTSPSTFTNGQTPLITAARLGYEEILHLLISSGVDVNRQTGRIADLDSPAESTHGGPSEGYRWTALTMAAWHGHENIVRRLLNCEDIDTNSVSLRPVAQRNRPISVYTLRSFGLMLEGEDIDTEGGNAVFWAVKQGHSGCILALLQPRRVTPTAEAIAQLRRLNSLKRRFDYGIECMLSRCEGANSAEARVAKLNEVTASDFEKLSARSRKTSRRVRRA